MAASPAAAACSVSVTGVAFGNYNPGNAAPDDSTGTINATCLIIDDVPSVAISTGSSGSFSPRQMASGGADLNYNLYTDASRAIVWGDGTRGTSAANLLLQGSFFIWRTYARTIYGRIPAGQNVTTGAYSDTLVVTVTF
ncbi:MAG: spore coat U domain-containing protein [Sphingomonas sp.]